jgi:hypothetical protein
MQARGPQWEMDGKGKRGFYPTDWRSKVKRILIWLDLAPKKGFELSEFKIREKGW